MALRGWLGEFGIVELLQIPYNGGKTCQMVVQSVRGEVALFYDHGKLVHAVLGDDYGEEVLKSLLDWEEGAFEIHEGVEAPVMTIDTDLRRLIMLGLKAHDSRKQADRKRTEKIGKSSAGLERRLEECLHRAGVISYLLLMDSSGRTIAQAGERPTGIEDLQKMVSTVIQGRLGRSFRRFFCEDDSGIVFALKLDERRALLAVSVGERAIGAISLAMSKLAAQLVEMDS